MRKETALAVPKCPWKLALGRTYFNSSLKLTNHSTETDPLSPSAPQVARSSRPERGWKCPAKFD